jgi:ADP-ribose pyrophosphatase YjhB (NUDIX family)
MVLLLQRPPHDRAFLGVGFPGGKLNKGESYEAAALRELHEETGLTGHITRQLPDRASSGRRRDYYIKVFEVAVTSQDVTLSNEHTAFHWVPVALAGPATVDILKSLFASDVAKKPRREAPPEPKCTCSVGLANGTCLPDCPRGKHTGKRYPTWEDVPDDVLSEEKYVERHGIPVPKCEGGCGHRRWDCDKGICPFCKMRKEHQEERDHPLAVKAAQGRPPNFEELDGEAQYMIDKRLGILDWLATPEEFETYKRLRNQLGKA